MELLLSTGWFIGGSYWSFGGIRRVIRGISWSIGGSLEFRRNMLEFW